MTEKKKGFIKFQCCSVLIDYSDMFTVVWKLTFDVYEEPFILSGFNFLSTKDKS